MAEVSMAGAGEHDMVSAQGADRREPRINTGRLSERFEVPGAVVTCKRRRLLTWRVIGPPCQLRDMSLMGLSFLHMAGDLPAETMLRMMIHMPSHLPVSLKGQVTRMTKLPDSLMWICGVHFTDYSADVWTVLCQLHRQYSESGRVAALRHQQTADLAAAVMKRRPVA